LAVEDGQLIKDFEDLFSKQFPIYEIYKAGVFSDSHEWKLDKLKAFKFSFSAI